MGEPARDLEIAQQTELFDLSRLPIRNDLVDMVKERSFLPALQPKKVFKHTGKIIIRKMMNDEELCIGLCTAVLSGVSARLIGMRYEISPKSVVAIREAMEARGELAPVRTRIVRLLDTVTELGLETVIDGLAAGQIPAGSAWIPALASVDKREQLSVGIVPGTDRTRKSITLEDVLAEHALAKSTLSPSDSGSDATAAQTVDIAPPATPANALDTTLDTGPKALPVPSGTTLDLPRATVTTPAREGGGGVAIPARPHDPRGDGPANSNL